MLTKPSTCNGCPLEKKGRGFTLPDGTGKLGIVVILESAGYEEVFDGLPVRPKAQAGSKFEECLGLAGIERQDLRIYNVVQCQPPNNELTGTEYGQGAINHCACHRDRVIMDTPPVGPTGRRVILALGGVSLSTLLGLNAGDLSIFAYRGFVIDSKMGLVIGGLHPSYIKRGNPELTPLLAFDMQRAVEVANGEFTNYPAHPDFRDFLINKFPSMDEAWQFYYRCKDSEKLIICFDIETPKSKWTPEDERDTISEDAQIIQIQFSVSNRTAIVFPWKDPYLDVVQALFLLPNVKSNQAAYGFDIPRLQAAGVKFHPTARIHDLMYLFKHWHPRLPRNLQSVASMCGFPYPWKHLADSDPQWYGGCDVIADQYLLRYLPEKMKQLGVWQGYIEEILEMWRILKKASDRGIPVNDRAREELKEIFRGERDKLNLEFQSLIPDEIRNIRPRRKQENGAIDYGYIREPKEVAQAREVYERAVKKRIERGVMEHPTFDQFVRAKFGLLEKTFQGLDGESGEVVTVKRWCKLEEAKASSQQIIRYLEWRKKELEGEN